MNIVTDLPGTASKADEIKWLCDAHDAVGMGCYLSSLFTDDFMAWIEQQISNDMDCDLYAHLADEREKRTSAESHAAGLQADLTASEKADALAQERYRAEIVKLELTISQAEDALDERDRTILQLKAKLFDLVTVHNLVD